jgi:hypothetical protein
MIHFGCYMIQKNQHSYALNEGQDCEDDDVYLDKLQMKGVKNLSSTCET